MSDMVKITVLTGNYDKAPKEIPLGSNKISIADLVREAEQFYPGLANRVFGQDGTPAEGYAVLLNGSNIQYL